MDFPDGRHDLQVLLFSVAFRSLCPRIMAADRDAEYSAHRPDSKRIFMSTDKVIYQ